MTLQAKLDAFRADFEAGKPPYSVPPSVIVTMHRATAELKDSGLVERARRVGEPAPAFTLNDTAGHPLSSAVLLSQGPLIVSFYRGVWCPYCNMELKALQNALPELEKLGARLVGISPQTMANNRKSIRQNHLNFPILSDTKGAVAESFGVKYKLPDYLVELYKALKNDLPRFNDDLEWTLPIPARYVIGQDGFIVYAEVNADYTHRPDPEEMLPILRKFAATIAA